MEQVTFYQYRDFILKEKITHGAIMNIGIDNLREINAAYGIEIGDKVVYSFSQIIAEEAGANKVYRMEGSDEFVLLFEACDHVSQGRHFFELVQNRIAEVCKDEKFFYTVSAGMVFFQEIKDNEEAVFTCAEYALNRAKERGKNRLFIYNREQFEEYMAQMALLSELQNAVNHDFEGFELYYQPIVSMESHKMVSAEALLRWKHPKYPQISPAQIIPILEESGLIIEVGRFIIEQAIRQQMEWEKISPGFVIHINLSYVQFNQEKIVDRVRLLIETTGVNPHNIMFELTESGFADQSAGIARQIDQLVDMGFQVALDDFGTGYSNFIYLKDLNIHMVKLDRVFITEAVNHANKRELLANIVTVVHSMGMEVCFEGIETMEDLAMLSKMSPEVVQGYVFGVPLPASVFQKNFQKFLNEEELSHLEKYQKSDASMLYLMNEIKEKEKKTKSVKRNSLRIVLILLPLLFIFMLGVGIVSFRINGNILLQQLDEKMEASLHSSKDQMDNKFSEAEDLAASTSYYVFHSYQTAELSDYEDMLNEVVAKYDRIAGSGIWFEPYVFNHQKATAPYVYKHNGQNMLTYYYQSEEYNYFEQPYYAEAKHTKKLVITDPYYDPTMGQTIITFSYPILTKSEEFRGTVTVDLYVDDMQQMLAEMKPSEGGFAFLTDGRQQIMNDEITIPEEMLKQLTNENGKFETTYQGKEYIVYYDTMQDTEWKTAVAVQKDGLYRPLVHMMIVLAGTEGIIFVVVILVCVAIFRTMQKQRLLELEQEDHLNKNQFKALRYSYMLILSVRFEDEKLTPIYVGPLAKQEQLIADTFSEFIKNCTPYIYKDDRKYFEDGTDIEYIKEQLKSQPYFISIGRMQIPEEDPKWLEVAISYTEEEDGKPGFLYMLRDINEQKMTSYKAIAENQSLVEQLRQKNEELFRMGITDKLTEIYNRDGMEYYAPAVLEKAGEEGNYLFLLLADVNKLKDTNDKYGHLRGDDAIKEAAQILSELDKEQILSARVGGDEFVLMGAFPKDEDIPEMILNRLKENFQKYANVIKETGVSYGYFWGATDGSQKLDYFYDYADRKMYEMKKTERMKR